MATSTSIRIELSYQGIGEIARSDAVRADMQRRADAVAQAARSAVSAQDAARITATSRIGQRRARASVFWAGGLADEMELRALGKAIDAARGPGIDIVRSMGR